MPSHQFRLSVIHTGVFNLFTFRDDLLRYVCRMYSTYEYSVITDAIQLNLLWQSLFLFSSCPPDPILGGFRRPPFLYSF